MLSEIKCLDVKEELEGLSDEERLNRISLKGDFERTLLMEEVMWRQKSRIKWLKEDDRKTKLLHKMASKHRRSNGINKLLVGRLGRIDQSVLAHI